jgi:uncharacterized membrane protein YesL
MRRANNHTTFTCRMSRNSVSLNLSRREYGMLYLELVTFIMRLTRLSDFSNGNFWNKYFGLTFGGYIYIFIYLTAFCSNSHFKQNHSASLPSSLCYSHSLPENIEAYTIGPLSYRVVVIRLKLVDTIKQHDRKS